MPYKLQQVRLWIWLCLAVACLNCPVFGAGLKTLHGHVPELSLHLTPIGKLSSTNELHLAIGLPLRDSQGLDQFLAEVYDPTSPNYRQFLTPVELAARFGPSEADYEAVEQFALTNGLKITSRHSNRLLLDVTGHPPEVEHAFHLNLRTFHHPTEKRDFFAPDTEPTVDADLPVTDIQGLSDNVRPRPRVRQQDMGTVVAQNGSSPDGQGAYIGNDFRNAYVPGTSLTGAGQMVGLVQFDGFYANDIAAYAQAAGGGRTNIVIQTVLLDGYNGIPTTGPNSGNIEVSLDIEMAMSMAPGLSKILVFEAGPSGLQNDILNSMLTYSNTVRQLSCSWGWGGGPTNTTDNVFRLMAAAGQSFFNATGDSDAFTIGTNSVNGVDNPSLPNSPSDSPYITQVGGTTLTMNGTGGSYASETVWNWGGGQGSSGGVSSFYTMPSWQANLSMAANGGSTTYRNVPDVALTADNVYVVYGGSAQGTSGIGGTSCAAPLWAGYLALVNQQAAGSGNAPAGFINPAVYAIGKGANPGYSYEQCFHDTTTGNNFSSSSPASYSAVSGYDLCTGWGTPNGTNLINALAGAHDALYLNPASGFVSFGALGGPFSPAIATFQLTNASAATLKWAVISAAAWLKPGFTNGTLAAHVATNLAVGLSAAASSLAVGGYSANLVFSNQSSHVIQSLPFSLQVLQPLDVSPVKGFSAVGPVGGPFVPGSQSFALTNLGGNTVNWSLIETSAWLGATSLAGSLATGGRTNVIVSIATAANALAAGVYSTSVIFSNSAGVAAVLPFTLSVGQPVILNGGFETGDFTDWTLSGNSASTSVTGNSTFVHGGTYGALLGPPNTPGYLTQNLTTVPGQNYLVSLWLVNGDGSTPNLFQVQWNGVTLGGVANLTATTWTNLQFLVTAAGSASVLQLGFQDDPYYLGLDDITVTPVANPGFSASVRSPASFKLTFDTTAGLVYQVQYVTNLTQATWINLGGPVTATTNTLTVSDTTATSMSPQRFYRLLVTP